MKKRIALFLLCANAFCIQAAVTKQNIRTAQVLEGYLRRQGFRSLSKPLPEAMKPHLEKMAEVALRIRTEEQAELPDEAVKQAVPVKAAQEYLQAIKFEKPTAVVGKKVEAPGVTIPIEEVVTNPPKKPEEVAQLPVKLTQELKERAVQRAVRDYINNTLTEHYLKEIKMENDELIIKFNDEDLIPILRIYAEHQMPFNKDFVEPLLLQKVLRFGVEKYGTTTQHVAGKTIDRLEELLESGRQEIVQQIFANIEEMKMTESQQKVFKYINTLRYQGEVKDIIGSTWTGTLRIDDKWLKGLIEICKNNIMIIDDAFVYPVLYKKIVQLGKENNFNADNLMKVTVERLQKLMVQAGFEPQQAGAAEQPQAEKPAEAVEGQQQQEEAGGQAQGAVEKPQAEKPAESPKLEQPKIEKPEGAGEEPAVVTGEQPKAEQPEEEQPVAEKPTDQQQKVLNYINTLSKDNVEEKGGSFATERQKYIKEEWLKGLASLCKENDIDPLMEDTVVYSALEAKLEKIAEEVGSGPKPFAERAESALKRLIKPKKK